MRSEPGALIAGCCFLLLLLSVSLMEAMMPAGEYLGRESGLARGVLMTTTQGPRNGTVEEGVRSERQHGITSLVQSGERLGVPQHDAGDCTLSRSTVPVRTAIALQPFKANQLSTLLTPMGEIGPDCTGWPL